MEEFHPALNSSGLVTALLENHPEMKL